MATLRGGTQAPRTFVTVPKKKDVLRETVVPTDTAHAWPALPGGSTDVGVRTRGIGVQCCPWNILSCAAPLFFQPLQLRDDADEISLTGPRKQDWRIAHA